MRRHLARKFYDQFSSATRKVHDSLSVGTLASGKRLARKTGVFGSIWANATNASERKSCVTRLCFQKRTASAVQLSQDPCFWHPKSEFSTFQPQLSQLEGIVQVPLAQTGEGIADCELLTWLVNEGDEVDEFQPLCSVQSDKASIEITSRFKGKVSRLNFMPGDVVKVGESLLELICGSSEGSGSSESSKNEFLNAQCDNVPKQDLYGNLLEDSSSKTLVTPAVRHLAKESGIKLEDVIGTGKDGRVLREDILKHIASREGLKEELSMISEIAPKQEHIVPQDPARDSEESEGHAASNVHSLEDKVIPMRGYQRAMVKTMTAAATIPHFYLVDELNVDTLANLRKNLKDVFLGKGIKLTYLPFMIKALSVALLKYPMVNSTFNKDASEICCKGSHNVGVAIATSHGLAVPNIKNVQSLTVLEIAKELSRLTQLASLNHLSSTDISGGTITITNFGSIGGKFGYPLLNSPETAIIAIGKTQKTAYFREDGSMYPALTMNVTWGADHRVIDGATIANICNEWKTLVEHPERLAMHLK